MHLATTQTRDADTGRHEDSSKYPQVIRVLMYLTDSFSVPGMMTKEAEIEMCWCSKCARVRFA